MIVLTLLFPFCFLFCCFFFNSAVQLDSCGAQDSGHPEHQDRALCCHEQRGLPLHFGMVSTHSSVPLKTNCDVITQVLGEKLPHYHCFELACALLILHSVEAVFESSTCIFNAAAVSRLTFGITFSNLLPFNPQRYELNLYINC